MASNKIRLNFCEQTEVYEVCDRLNANKILVWREECGNLDRESFLKCPRLHGAAALIDLFDFTPNLGVQTKINVPSPSSSQGHFPSARPVEQYVNDDYRSYYPPHEYENPRDSQPYYPPREYESPRDAQPYFPPRSQQSFPYNRCSPHQNTGYSPPTLPQGVHYDGKSNWKAFKNKFTCYATSSGWSALE